MTKYKSGLAFLLALVLTLALGVQAIAQGSNSSFVIEVDGVRYEASEHIDIDGNKVITVVGGNEINTIVNDGMSLQIDTQFLVSNVTKSVSFDIMELQPNTSPTQRASASKKSLWWNYYYYYSDSSINTHGMFFSLTSGDTYGGWTGYDNNNTTARNLAYDFCTDVRNLDTAQWAASAASGTSGASIAAAIASAGPTAGVGAVIGIVVAIVSGGVAVAEWIAAYNYSLDCNQHFLQFTQSL